jgi:hypothetical protein
MGLQSNNGAEMRALVYAVGALTLDKRLPLPYHELSLLNELLLVLDYRHEDSLKGCTTLLVRNKIKSDLEPRKK